MPNSRDFKFLNKTTRLLFKSFLDSGLHLGHQQKISSTNSYLLGLRDSYCVFNLEKTLTLLQRRLRLLLFISQQKGIVWWIGTSQSTSLLTKDLAYSFYQSDQPNNNRVFLTRSWIPGLLTNSSTFKLISQRFIQQNQSCVKSLRLNQKLFLDTKFSRGLDYSIFRQRKKGDRFKDFISLRLQTSGKYNRPDLLVILNPKDNLIAIKEAQKLNIPVIAFVDSDVSISNIRYPIPLSDDTPKGILLCLQLFLKLLNISFKYNQNSLGKQASGFHNKINPDSGLYWSKVKNEYSQLHRKLKY
jgi:small subunit ribosomal protein S2